ncbi:GD12034 [Drosophila simulans]|uniref:GD12034 n=1 Tax=Drosophila simulans TaxID=7240 RepID=B4NS04_DROSI|nr:GD12034 [Drosophila simulans]
MSALISTAVFWNPGGYLLGVRCCAYPVRGSAPEHYQIGEGGLCPIPVFSKLTTDDLVRNIETLINDPQYKRSALEVSQRFRDNPIHPLAEATFWIEYIIRHRGARHLKSHGAFIPLHQYLLLDVLGCLLLGAFLAIWLPWRMIRRVHKWWLKGESSDKLNEGKKRL